jgi:hypothetical protein
MPNPSSLPLVAIAPGGPPLVPGPEVPDPAQVPHRDPEPGTPQKDPQPELPREDPQHGVPEIDPQPELPRVDPPVFPLDPSDPQPQVEYL